MTDKKKELTHILNKINQDFQKGKKTDRKLIALASDIKDQLVPKYIPTNVPDLNKLLGGGLATKCGHLIAGSPGAGKTALCFSMIKECLNRYPDKFVLYVMAEPPFPYHFVEEFGLELDRFIVLNPADYGERVLDAILELLYNNKTGDLKDLISVIVWDSMNNTNAKRTTDRIDDKGLEAVGMADSALMVTKFVQLVSGRGLLENDTMLLIIAQLRANMSGYGDPYQISGALAAQFNCKTNILMTHSIKKEAVDGIQLPKRQEVKVFIKKNNVGGKPAATSYIYDYELGLDDSAGLFNQGLDYGIIYKKGKSTYIINIDGVEHAFESKKADVPLHIGQNPDLKEQLRNAINSIVLAPALDEINAVESEEEVKETNEIN